MGRPPCTGGPAFRFTQNEVVEMEVCLQEINNSVPTREIVNALADKFSASPERTGKSIVQPKQVWNWFQNRRYSQKAKVAKAQPVKPSVPPMLREDSTSFRNVAPPVSAPLGNPLDSCSLEFEAKSARDGAWYDVAAFLSAKDHETRDPEVRVRFIGFGVEEDEWVNVRTCVRQRSLPCENSECVAVLAGDLILCFQEGKEQALYFDAHVLDAQRRRHDVRGCRCRFLVRYDRDQSEEIVALRKICRRPETDYRLQALQASRVVHKAAPAPSEPTLANGFTAAPLQMKHRKQRKLMDVYTEEVTLAAPNVREHINYSVQTSVPVKTKTAASSDAVMEDAIVAPAPTSATAVSRVSDGTADQTTS